tara:strand:+ start:3436 stop:4317 length:882 start_codon:yes stop_codon:yes gene_type:complete
MKLFKRRSLLFVPAIKENYYDNINSINCDAVIFDLEDSVPISCKEKARKILHEKFNIHRDKGKELIIRVNDCRSKFIHDDLSLAIKLKPDTILVPKAEDKDIEFVDNFLKDMEDLSYLLLIETVKGYLDCKEILGFSKKITGNIFGAEDFSADIGIERTEYYHNPVFFQAVIQLMLLSKYYNIDFIDSVYPYLFTDEALKGLIDEASLSKKMGAVGKLAVHPSQVELINQVYSPNSAEIEKTKLIISELEKAEKENELSIFKFQNRMMDMPERKRAKKIFEHAKRFNPAKERP